MFFGVVISNTLIGTIQELRAKQSLDRLAVLSAPKAHVVRDGLEAEIDVHEIVLDDVLDLQPGNQVPADGDDARRLATSRSTSPCSPARPTRSSSSPATTSCPAASSSPAVGAPR